MSAKPTAKQAKAMQLIREGERPTIAMRKAGYTPKTAEAPSQNLLRSAAVGSIIEQYQAEYLQVGITPQYMAKKTAEWLDAVKISSSLTEPDRIVPDYQTQLKAAELVRKDWGMGQQEGTPFVQGEMSITFRPAATDGSNTA